MTSSPTNCASRATVRSSHRTSASSGSTRRRATSRTTRRSQYPPLRAPASSSPKKADGRLFSCGDLANLMKDGDIDGYMLKPMNCPHHIRIFASEPHSYRDLPVRLAEFGTVYRWEKSGEIGGLTRVRGFTQDDAHLFCTEDQIEAGTARLSRAGEDHLSDARHARLPRARRPPRSRQRRSTSAIPRTGTRRRKRVATLPRSLGVPFSEEAGEAAFYGPKIDFVVKDVVGREWQLGTVQVDYNLPERFDLSYIGADNAAAPTSDDPPRAVRVVRTLHRRAHRALRRRVSRRGSPRSRCASSRSARRASTTAARCFAALTEAGVRVDARRR